MFNQLELCVCVSVSETRVECADRFVYSFARMHYLYGNWLVFSTNMRSGFSWIDHFEMEAWRWKKSEANIVHDPSVFIFLSSLSSLLNIPVSKEKKLAEMKRNENGWMQNPSSWIETLQRSKSTRKYSATLHSYKWWQKFDLIYLFDVCGLCDFVCASFFLVALQLQELKRQFADGTCKRVQCNAMCGVSMVFVRIELFQMKCPTSTIISLTIAKNQHQNCAHSFRKQCEKWQMIERAKCQQIAII